MSDLHFATKPIGLGFPLLAAILGILMVIPATARGNDTQNPREPEIGPVVPVVSLPKDRPDEFVEGIATSRQGDLYVGQGYSGYIYKIDDHGSLSILAKLVPNYDDGYLLGLAVNAENTVFAAVWPYNLPSIGGVWRVQPNGAADLIMPMPGIPNAIAFDEDGNLYATESAGGSVWRLGCDGNTGMLWVQDPLLAPLSGFGANGIAYREHALWVLNYDAGSIVKIPIHPDGSPGKPSIFVQSPLLVGPDGMQFDVKGNLYIGLLGAGSLVRVSPEGKLDVLITEEQFGGSFFPINPVFGFGKDLKTLYITGSTTGVAPDVVKVNVGVPGMLLPQFREGRCKGR